ncbi:hypothetical protein BAE44_0002371 [Dichanthelium oligosanthes]|uniref:DUF4220 domain-containing protein n=1 Tax=Dichanthelium oligosanthes TaxID=888268 RepID=A0A1E5WGT8_9POAL|nr:hypothetical protein BAE44_0002371 [Dichanthelium oligosanthes]
MTAMNSSIGLVTIDKVWLLDDKLLASAPWLKDVCLSFALFKLLRCRFAAYTVAEAGFQEVYSFFLHVLLRDKDHERVYGVITDELSFLHDYYYSSTPIHYSNFWLLIVNIFTSFFAISYCLLYAGLPMSGILYEYGDAGQGQVYCAMFCHDPSYDYDSMHVSFGNIVVDVVPVAILLVLVVLAEAKEIACYICSNWTKVALNNHDNWQRSPRIQKWNGRILRYRCKLMKHWDDKMSLCSMLVLHPRRTDPIIALVMLLLHLPDRKKNVKVPRVVKAAIVNALRNNNGLLTDPATFLYQSQNFLWACESKGISDIILMWHIATSILGVRHQHPPLSDDMTIATHLSRYCAYLVAYVPELLPDDDEWCKSLYMAVKKDSMCALPGGVAASTAEGKYNKLVSKLHRRAKHKVLRNSVKLCKQLAELREGEEACVEVARWILVADDPVHRSVGQPAMLTRARGRDLITLVWALLMHVGIASRPRAAGAPATGDRI